MIRQEKDILNSEEYKKIIENTSDLIALVSFSIKPVYLYISPSHKRIFGYLPEDLVGKPSLEFIHSDDKERLFSLLKQYIGAKAKKLLSRNSLESNKKIEYRFKDKKGNWHNLESTVDLLGNKFLFVSRDVTERKQVEEKLKESEEKFKTLLKNTPVGIYYNDFSGKFLYGNKRAEEIIGYTKDELIGQSFLKLKLLKTSQLSKAVKSLVQNRIGKSTGPDEFILNRKDGDEKHVEISTRVIEIAGEKVVLGMVIDITDRKKIEEEVNKRNLELEKANKLMIGRELKMIELKKKIRELEANN